MEHVMKYNIRSIRTRKSKIVIFQGVELQYAVAGLLADDLFQPVHLYFTSDDAIKKGDMFVTVQGDFFRSICGKSHPVYSDRKVIASTDSAKGLPMIPDSFIEKYVKCNGKIDNVELVTLAQHSTDNSEVETEYKPMLTDNTVVIANFT